MGRPTEDLTGKRFGRLVALRRSERAIKSGNVSWVCRCDCGKIKDVLSTDLRSGKTVSCGCYRLERMTEVLKKYNEYDLSGEYGIGRDVRGREFYFDIEDYDKIKDINWNVDAKNGRVHGNTSNKEKRNVSMHKIITGTSSDVIIDHKNGKPYDNRKENLRVATKQENCRNRRASSNNKLGVKGVSKTKSGKYHASIWDGEKSIYLGLYKTLEEAKEARQIAEVKYFGEFARIE